MRITFVASVLARNNDTTSTEKKMHVIILLDPILIIFEQTQLNYSYKYNYNFSFISFLSRSSHRPSHDEPPQYIYTRAIYTRTRKYQKYNI